MTCVASELDFVQLFVISARVLERTLQKVVTRIKPNGMIWASWPKKASKVSTDVSEDVVRKIALPLGLVDVKVCAIDDVWSALKLVLGKEKRTNTL
jgi:hypothetical protein